MSKQLVQCISFNPHFAECLVCYHKEPHQSSVTCDIKHACALATIRGMKGWCKAYSTPKQVVDKKLYLPTPKL